MVRPVLAALLLLAALLAGCLFAGDRPGGDAEGPSPPTDRPAVEVPWATEADPVDLTAALASLEFDGIERFVPADESTWDALLVGARHPLFPSLATPVDDSNPVPPFTFGPAPPAADVPPYTRPAPPLGVRTPEGIPPPQPGPGSLSEAPCTRPVYDAGQLDIFSEYLVAQHARMAPRAAALAVTDWCGLLYNGAYGVYGVNPNRPPGTWDDAPAFDALYRIGSMSKVLGAAALQHLVATTTLDWDDRVFCLSQWNPDDDCILYYVGSKPGGTLGSVQNADLTLITLRHLQGHSSGLNVANPLVFEHEVSTDIGNNGAADLTPWDFIWWHVDEPLKFLPGTAHQYSNFGHFMVGPIVEIVSGKPYMQYLCENVLAPVDIDCSDIILANSRPYEWNAREIGHDHCDADNQDHFAKSPWHEDAAWPVPFGQDTCRDKGGLMLKVAATTGGIASTAEAQALFYQHYWSPWAGSPHGGMPRTQYWTPPDGATMWGGTANWPAFDEGWDDVYGHNGGLQDVRTMGQQCTSGFNMVLLTATQVGSKLGEAMPTPWDLCDVGEEFQDTPMLGMTFAPSGAMTWKHAITPAAEMQAFFDTAAATHRLLDINGYRMGDGYYYATTWVERGASEPAWLATWGKSHDDMLAVDEAWRSEGFYAVKISAYMVDATPTYAAVYHGNPNGYRYELVLDASPEEFYAKRDGYENSRLRMRASSLDTFQPSGVFPRLAGIFVGDRNESYIFFSSPLDDIESTRESLGSNWRVTELEPRNWGDVVLYAGLIEKDAPATDYRGLGNWDGQRLMDDWKQNEDRVPISIAGADTAWFNAAPVGLG